MFGGTVRNLHDPLLRFGRAVADLISPARTFPESALAGSEDAGDVAEDATRGLSVSNWIIVAVLGLTFAIVALSLLDSSLIVIRMLHQHRVSTIFGVTLVELALISAMVLRDGNRRKTERRLHENEARMALAAGAADVGLWRWHAGSDRFWMTDRCREILLVDTGCGLGAIYAAIHPDDLARVKSALQGARAGTRFDIEFRVAAGGNPVRWLRGRGWSESGVDGKPPCVAGSVVDISEHVTMRAEIDRQRQSLIHLTRVGTVGELSGALAHELNQPLTAILSNAQAIQRMIGQEPINLEELRNAISDIVDDDSRAGDIIRHLRTLLKRTPARHDPVDMQILADRTVHLVRNELVARRIASVVTASDDPMTVMGDAVQLQQLLLNLILNAAEAISEAGQKNGVVLINGEIVGGGGDRRYHLAVSDTGKGICPEVVERLFEPFFSTKDHGLGLGLSICRAIVDGHGGKIYADRNEWGGASFHVFLPAAPLSRS